MSGAWKKSITNSNSRCLLENWMEERTTKEIDKAWVKNGPSSHPGFLSVFDDKFGLTSTTYKSEYQPKRIPPEEIGAKTKDRSDGICRAVKKEIEAEQKKLDLPIDYRSTTTLDFYSKPLPQRPKRSRLNMCELASEQYPTFWTDHYSLLPGISQTSKMVKPFRRNTNFSTPVELKMDAPQPYEMKGYTSMDSMMH